MKQISIILTATLLLLTTVSMKAQQEPSDYFAGKWEVLLEGTPSGDVTMTMTLERKDGKLEGYMSGDGDEVTNFTSVEEGEESVTVNWTSQGYDVYLELKKKDEDNISGSLMDMFSASGKRIKE